MGAERMSTGRLLAVMATAVLVAAVAGCARPATPAREPVPGELLDAGLVADPTFGGILTFGGIHTASDGSQRPLATTRTWDGTAWHTLTPPTSPPAREDPLLVADPATRQVLLFGGTSSPTAAVDPGTSGHAGTGHTGTGQAGPARRLTDAWTWDGHTWQQIPGYAAQVTGHAAYDPATGTVVLVGTVLPTASAEQVVPPMDSTGTWSWTGRAWVRVSPAVPSNDLTSLAYDPTSHHLLGLAAQAPYSPPACHGTRCPQPASRIGYARAWSFDGHSWQRDPTDTHLDQTGATLTADPTTNTLLLVTDTGHTWTRQPTGWTRLTPTRSPPSRAANTQVSLHAAATTNQVLLIVSDPTDHAWSFDGHTWTDRGALP
jgi:hypothetical protein